MRNEQPELWWILNVAKRAINTKSKTVIKDRFVLHWLGSLLLLTSACDKPPTSAGSDSGAAKLSARAAPEVVGTIDMGDVWSGEPSARDFALAPFVGTARVVYAKGDCTCTDLEVADLQETGDQALSVVLIPNQEEGSLLQHICLASETNAWLLNLTANVLPSAAISNRAFDLGTIESGTEHSATITIDCLKPQPLILEVSEVKGDWVSAHARQGKTPLEYIVTVHCDAGAPLGAVIGEIVVQEPNSIRRFVFPVRGLITGPFTTDRSYLVIDEAEAESSLLLDLRDEFRRFEDFVIDRVPPGISASVETKNERQIRLVVRSAPEVGRRDQESKQEPPVVGLRGSVDGKTVRFGVRVHLADSHDIER